MGLDLLPPGMGWGVWWALMGSSFATSFITAAFGIGGGAILLAILASLLPPAVLIPVHGFIQFGSNFGRVAIMLRYVQWSVLPAFMIGSVIGAALGGVLVVNIPPAAVQLGVGAFILWSVSARPPRLMRRWAALTGAISSFLTMFFGATGAFVASYVRTLELERHAHVATHSTMMTAQHLLKTLAFGLLGFAFGPWMPFTLAMIAVGLVGTISGRLVLTRITDARFQWALTAILVVLALRLIWSGGTDLLSG